MRVAAIAGQRFRAKIIMGTAVSVCVLGPAGITRRKHEGDGATPAGSFRVQYLLFRADRGPRPTSQIPAVSIAHDAGWCDDVSCPSYNRKIRLPFGGRHERLWREDRLYNLVVVIGYNMKPVFKGRGSAIFLHVEAFEKSPTAGCIAVEPGMLRRLLGRIDRTTKLVIG